MTDVFPARSFATTAPLTDWNCKSLAGCHLRGWHKLLHYCRSSSWRLMRLRLLNTIMCWMLPLIISPSFSAAARDPGGEQPQLQPTLTPLSSQPAHLSSVGRGREKEEGGAGAPKAGGGEEEERGGGAGAAASPGREAEEREAGGGGEEEEGGGGGGEEEEAGGRAKTAEEERGGEGGRKEAAGSLRAAVQRAGENLRAAVVVSRDNAPPAVLTLYSPVFLICPSRWQ